MEVLDEPHSHCTCLHNMESMFGGDKVTGVSFDDDTSVGCLLHDAGYTIEDSQNVTQDKQKKSNVSQDPKMESTIVWDFTIKHL